MGSLNMMRFGMGVLICLSDFLNVVFIGFCLCRMFLWCFCWVFIMICCCGIS